MCFIYLFVLIEMKHCHKAYNYRNKHDNIKNAKHFYFISLKVSCNPHASYMQVTCKLQSNSQGKLQTSYMQVMQQFTYKLHATYMQVTFKLQGKLQGNPHTSYMQVTCKL